MQDKVMSQTQTCVTTVYAQSLSVQCDLSFQASDIIHALGTSASHDDICAKKF